jgi:hypothetical protein
MSRPFRLSIVKLGKTLQVVSFEGFFDFKLPSKQSKISNIQARH